MKTDERLFIVSRLDKDTGKVTLFFYNWREHFGRVDLWIECFDHYHEHGQVTRKYYLLNTVPVPQAQEEEARKLFKRYASLDDDAEYVMTKKLIKHPHLKQAIKRNNRINHF